MSGRGTRGLKLPRGRCLGWGGLVCAQPPAPAHPAPARAASGVSTPGGSSAPCQGPETPLPAPTLMMSSLLDLHSTIAETSTMTPLSSMAMTFTGMATVRPVRMAVLMISVSWGQGTKRTNTLEDSLSLIPAGPSPAPALGQRRTHMRVGGWDVWMYRCYGASGRSLRGFQPIPNIKPDKLSSRQEHNSKPAHHGQGHDGPDVPLDNR